MTCDICQASAVPGSSFCRDCRTTMAMHDDAQRGTDTMIDYYRMRHPDVDVRSLRQSMVEFGDDLVREEAAIEYRASVKRTRRAR